MGKNGIEIGAALVDHRRQADDLGASAHHNQQFQFSVVFEGEAGSKEERLMLGLRLSSGVNLSQIYGEIPESVKKKINLLQKAGYLKVDLPHISLTDSGMLISNSIITELLE